MEVPRHWRSESWRYGLKVRVGEDGRAKGDCPTGVRDFIEGKRAEQDQTVGLVVQGLGGLVPTVEKSKVE